MSKNYDNSGVFGADHPTSYPQQGYAHTKITVKKGQVLNGTYTVAEPNRCDTAAQFDIYNRPEAITKITTSKGVLEQSDTKYGIGFVAKKLSSTDAKCKTVDTTTTKTVEKTTSTVAKETSIPAETTSAADVSGQTTETASPVVSELPKTGVSGAISQIIGAGLLTAATFYFIKSRR